MKIENDALDIAVRIKEVDADYYIKFNFKTNKFELYGRGGIKLLTFPYDRLDERAVVYARRTRAERAEEIIAEIDRHNERIEQEAQKNALEQLKI